MMVVMFSMVRMFRRLSGSLGEEVMPIAMPYTADHAGGAAESGRDGQTRVTRVGRFGGIMSEERQPVFLKEIVSVHFVIFQLSSYPLLISVFPRKGSFTRFPSSLFSTRCSRLLFCNRRSGRCH